MTTEEAQSLVDDATFDHVSGDSAIALEKLGRATRECPESAPAWLAAAEINLSLRQLDRALEAAERAHAIDAGDPLVIATLSRIWMERGDKARAEQFGARARVQGWKDELKGPADAGGLR